MSAEPTQLAAPDAPARSWKPYPEYKDSGVEWIREIPEHWDIKKLKSVCYMKGRIGWQGLKQSEFTTEGPYLITGMNFKDGVIRWEEVYHITEERYNEAPEIQLRVDDVLMTKDGTIGKLLYVDSLPDKASLNSHLLVLRPLKESFLSKYLYYLLQSEAFKIHIELNKTGTTFFGITQEAVGIFKMILPSKNEQHTIARYLDNHTPKIDTLIEKKQKLIELLKEERTAIINQAVTKGLNPDVPMKDSGIEWLGEIPKHWEVKKLKYLTTKIGSGVTPKGGSENYLKEGIPFLRSQNIHFEGLIFDDIAYISEETHNKMSGSKAYPNDVLLNITGASIGRCHFVPIELKEANVNQHVCIIRLNNKIITKYLFNYLSSEKGQTQIFSSEKGISREGLTYEQIGNFIITIPQVEEQELIIQFIESEYTKNYYTISKIEKEIALLQEYRTALISEVVTGKIDVREAI